MKNERIERALVALQKGKMVIVADDDDRECEGDFVMAANLVSDADVNLMAGRGRGLICCAISSGIARRLDLHVQKGSLHDTAFTRSVDYVIGTTTGISCADRAAGLRALADPQTHLRAFASPGHLFPLIARDGGVLERRGHTEAAVDLCRLAGLPQAGVICEIMNDDGTMARGQQLIDLAQELDMVFLTVEDIAAWRKVHESRWIIGAGGRIPTEHGNFTLHALQPAYLGSENAYAGSTQNTMQPMLLCMGMETDGLLQIQPNMDGILVRIHSECATGDLFGSLRCDCGPQLRLAMQEIAREGRGLIIYMRHEGRGIGLDAKLQAYRLQDQGLDTVDANIALGLPIDARDYADAAALLKQLGCHNIRLLSNNPDKVHALVAQGITVSERVGLRVVPSAHNYHYLQTKRERCGHDLGEQRIQK